MVIPMRAPLLLLCSLTFVQAADATLEKRAVAILERACADCHSHAAKKMKGGLALDSRAALLEGGDTGAAIIPGDTEKSLLVKAIRYADEDLAMPPKGKRLPAEDVATLEAWIKAGAPWQAKASNAEALTGRPARKPGVITEADRGWWSFQPLAQVEPPKAALGDSGWAKNDVDRFIAARLSDAGLAPAPQADRATLIRRVTFTLTGLPPTPEEVAAFVADQAPDAYEKLVDRLLANPAYGEHWARHWLDLVRYADSDGFRIDHYRPDAYRYRDYVVRSLNSDKPYDRFVQEQLAGDELFPDQPEALVATGYLRHWSYEYNNRDVVTQRDNILVDLTDTTADVFMGLGLGCARCHDHKFDPLLQKDYFRLRAFFEPLVPRDDLTATTAAERAAHTKAMATWEAKTADVRGKITDLEAPYRVKAEKSALDKFPPETQEIWAKSAKERTPQEAIYADLVQRQVQYELDRLMTYVKADEKPKLIALQQELTALEKDKPKALPIAFAATDVGPTAPPTMIPRKTAMGVIAPGYPTILSADPANVPAASATSTNRRATLARWLTEETNPLTARVLVNRVWQYHFGAGLAINSSDFGMLGEPPSHPALLDWLSRRFIAEGWSLKKLHRQLLLSATWQQSATNPQAEAARLKDPENRLHWRSGTRRLGAEAIRDAVLSVTGEIDLDHGGPGVDGAKARRSLYVKVQRNRRDALLDVFDVAEGFSSTASRNITTTPRQSLLLFNGEWALARARAFAARLMKDVQGSGGEAVAKRITRAYQLAYGRAPTAVELAEASAFLGAQKDVGGGAQVQASLIADKLPFRDGRSAVLSPGTMQDRLMVGDRAALPVGDLTIEAFVLLRSPYENADVRTIAARWDGDLKNPGWSFGVTGKKSRYKPMTLLFQISTGAEGAKEAEPLFSGLFLQPGRPYFVAVSVRLADGGEGKDGGVTFYIKDLSNDDEPMQTARVPHKTTTLPEIAAPLTIGGRWGAQKHLWDGLIDDVRLSDVAMRGEQLLLTSEGLTDHTVGYWRFESRTGAFNDSSPHGRHLMTLTTDAGVRDTSLDAWIDFCHVIINSNELIYVD
jgi:mono/diheme cytochrome c family protein